MQQQVHPNDPGYRLVRRLRGLDRVRGWRRLAAVLAPPGRAGQFIVENDGILFAGDLGSYLEREIYLFGQYERDLIRLFVDMVPAGRRRVALDIGANIGTHSLCFAQVFREVHAFEPNPALWPVFERNLALNPGLDNVSLHKVGLGASSGVLPFYAIDKDNAGLGTFSDAEQYDKPLRQIGEARLERGDDVARDHGIGEVDAVKIDVQGLEPDVLSGLAETLGAWRPIVWFEYGAGTGARLLDRDSIQALFPYPVTLWRLRTRRTLLGYRTEREIVGDGPLQDENYVAVPRGD